MNDVQMGSKKVLPLLVGLSVPAMIGMLVNAVYNIVDRIFIGNEPSLGYLGISAITFCFPVMLTLMALSLNVGVGGGTRFSICLGAGKKDEAAKYLGNSFMLSIIFGAVFMIFGNIFIEPILVILGTGKDAMNYAKDFLSVILFGAVFQCVSMCGNNFSRAQGNAKNAMVSQLIGAGFNIVFDYILIFKFGMGIKGAAYATIGGQFLSMVWQLAFLTSKRSIVRLTFASMKMEVKYVKDIITTGLPVFFMQMANSVLNVILNGTLVAYGGNIAVSSIGIITSFQTILLMPITGLAQGQQPIVSYNLGAKKMDRVKEALRLSVIGATIISVVGFLIIQLFPSSIISLFNQDPKVIAMGTNAIRVWFIFLPVVGAQLICANYFQALGKIKQASLLNLIRQIIVLIPLIIILSNIFGLYGIFFAVPIADITAFAITMFAIKRELKLENKLLNEEVVLDERQEVVEEGTIILNENIELD